MPQRRGRSHGRRRDAGQGPRPAAAVEDGMRHGREEPRLAAPARRGGGIGPEATLQPSSPSNPCNYHQATFLTNYCNYNYHRDYNKVVLQLLWEEVRTHEVRHACRGAIDFLTTQRQQQRQQQPKTLLLLLLSWRYAPRWARSSGSGRSSRGSGTTSSGWRSRRSTPRRLLLAAAAAAAAVLAEAEAAAAAAAINKGVHPTRAPGHDPGGDPVLGRRVPARGRAP